MAWRLMGARSRWPAIGCSGRSEGAFVESHPERFGRREGAVKRKLLRRLDFRIQRFTHSRQFLRDFDYLLVGS